MEAKVATLLLVIVTLLSTPITVSAEGELPVICTEAGCFLRLRSASVRPPLLAYNNRNLLHAAYFSQQPKDRRVSDGAHEDSKLFIPPSGPARLIGDSQTKANQALWVIPIAYRTAAVDVSPSAVLVDMPQARYFGNFFVLLMLLVLSLASSNGQRTKRQAPSVQADSLALEDMVKRNWANKIRFGKREDDEAQKRWASQLRFGKRFTADDNTDTDSPDLENKRGSWASKVRFG
uniref:Uncharacterized protein n=1 Tax=Plectus sambesii TaxID=2011161 RepID=A0A914VXR3_9BILA